MADGLAHDRFAEQGLGDGDFFVGGEVGAHGFADFGEGGVGFHGVVDVGHEIFGAFGGFAESVEAALDFGGRTIGAELAQALGLPVGYGFVNLEQVHRSFWSDVVVYADDDFFFLIHGHLVAVGRFGDFALRVALLDRRYHAAHGVDAANVIPRAVFHFVRERFHKIRAAERVHRVGAAGLVPDDLLHPPTDRAAIPHPQTPRFVPRLRA